jgi:hypothetical protein
MYRKTYSTQSTVAPVDKGQAPLEERQAQNNPVPSPTEVTWGLAAAFAPIWLSIAAGALIGVAGNSSYVMALPCMVVIPLIGCVGLFNLFRPGPLLGAVLLLYLPVGVIATAALGWLSMVGFGNAIYLY